MRLNELSATRIVHGIAAGKFTAEAVTRDCLARIAEREDTVKAWAFLDRDIALAQACERDRSGHKGPLHGVPIGVKDIFATRDMPTDMGSPIYKNNRTATDASSVAMVRAAGAVILGKTVTCEFAGLTANVTRNPLNPEHTPGGSSSGSGAAVADHMVTVAFGTQTGGSVLRPASFCGVVGYKPTYNLICRGGIQFAAELRDTIGLLARELDDVDLVASVLTARDLSPRRDTPPTIGLCRTPLWDAASAETKHAVEDAAKRLASAGATIRDVALPASFEALSDARTIINPVERSRALAHEWATNRALISAGLTRQIEDGLKIPYTVYVQSLQRIKACRDQVPDVFGDADILLAPCATGEAPKGLAATGDPKFQEFWTALHVPTLTLPTHKGPHGLPVGIQLVGRLYDDERLIAAARWVFERLGARLMEINNSFDVPLKPAEAWKVLMDIPRIAPCMPGAELTGQADKDSYNGKVSVKLGPVALAFAGQVKFTEIDEAGHKARAKAQGKDSKGRGGANATVDFHIEPAGTGSRVVVKTDLSLSGAVAQYGRASGLIQEVASQLVGQFAANLKAQLDAEKPAQQENAKRTEPQHPAAKPISGFSLIFKALWNSLRRLLGGK